MLKKLSLIQAITDLNQKKVSIDEIYNYIYDQIKKNNKKLNVFLNIKSKKKALQEAKLKNKLPLKGLPIAVKDNFCTKEFPTTASARLLKKFYSPYESTVTQKLIDAGAVIIGKTNMDAWAHGSSTETSDFGPTLNPHNPKYLPGGSSGGSAAAVAADMCSAAIGSETAGSIRGPAAWCGIVGLKPTYGRVSRYGVIAMASSTDSPGPLTKTVADAQLLLNIIQGNDLHDGTSIKEKIFLPDLKKYQVNKQALKGVKIGILYLNIKGLEKIKKIYQKQISLFTKLGAEVSLAKAMNPQDAISVYTIIQRAEVSSNLARFDGIRFGEKRSFFGSEAKRRIFLGTYTLSKGYADQYYLLAQKVRTLFVNDFKRLFNQFDVLVSPTMPGYAPKVGVTKESAMYGELADLLQEPSSISGLPGISIPCFHDQKTNLYLGLNINTPMLREDLMLKIAYLYEQANKIN